MNIQDLGYLIGITDPIVNQELEKSMGAVGDDEYVKILNGLDGWLVVVPQTMKAAQKYGMGTKWCTTAKDESFNMFDSYNKNGALFIFIGGDTKFQWWGDLTGNRATQLMDVLNKPAKYDAIPEHIWDNVIVAKTDIPHIQKSLKLMKNWVNEMDPQEPESEDFRHGPIDPAEYFDD